MNERRPVPLPRYRRPERDLGAAGSFSAADAQAVMRSGQHEARNEIEPAWLRFVGAAFFLCLAVSSFGLWLTVRDQHPFVGPANGTDRYFAIIAVPWVAMTVLAIPMWHYQLRAFRGIRGRSRVEMITRMVVVFVFMFGGQRVLDSANSDAAKVWRLFPVGIALLGCVMSVVWYLAFNRRITRASLFTLFVLLLSAATGAHTMFLVWSLGMVVTAVAFALGYSGVRDQEWP